MANEDVCHTSHNSASNAILNCKAPKTPHYSLVQRSSRANRYAKYTCHNNWNFNNVSNFFKKTIMTRWIKITLLIFIGIFGLSVSRIIYDISQNQTNDVAKQWALVISILLFAFEALIVSFVSFIVRLFYSLVKKDKTFLPNLFIKFKNLFFKKWIIISNIFTVGTCIFILSQYQIINEVDPKNETVP